MKTAFTLLLSCLVLVAVAQNQEGDINTADLPKLSEPVKDKLDFNFSVGTSFMVMPKYGSTLSHFVAPQLTYKVSDKFRISSGVLFQYSSLNTTQTAAAESSFMFLRPKYQFNGFVAGEYDINEKLTLTGRVFAGSTVVDVPGLNPDTYRFATYGVAGGFKYKLSEHASFQAEIQLTRGNQPYIQGRPSSNLEQPSLHGYGPWDYNW